MKMSDLFTVLFGAAASKAPRVNPPRSRGCDLMLVGHDRRGRAVFTHVNRSKTYAPNGKREVARRLRQMEARNG